VSVENLETGVKLTGDDAPLSTELNQWLLENPGFVLDIYLLNALGDIYQVHTHK